MLLSGVGGYKLGGPAAYENSAHTLLLANNTAGACITCHMAKQEAAASGGHTFRVTNESGVLNPTACVACHPVAADLAVLMTDRQGQIDAKMEELRLLLVARGLLDGTTDLNTKGDFEGHEAGALYNYKYIQEDQSRGVHNFKYAMALLNNSIAAMQ
jgi:hypothetical protein